MVERFRTRRFLALLAGFFCLSAGYWLLRMQLVSGMRQHQVSDILGAFAKVWFSYSGGYLFSVLLALIALSGPLLFIRQRRWLPLALWATGSFMYGLGVLQLWGARGLVWSLTPELTEYHMLLPYAGISLLAGVSIAGWNLNWNLVGYTLAGALAVFYLHRTGEISEMAVLQSQAVIKTRAAFFLELKQLLDSGAALPDKSVGKMSYLHMKNMDWTEIKLFTDKEMLRTYGAPEYFNLQTLSYVYGGHRYDFLPADTPPERLDPAARQFVQKYWPAKPRSM